MKTKSILLISFIASTSLAYAQFGVLNKARNLAGNSSSNSNTNSNNNSTNTPPASTTNSTPASTNNSTTTNASKSGSSASQTTAATINFSNSAGQKTTDYKDGDAVSARVDFAGPMNDLGGKKYDDAFVINIFDGTKFLNGEKLKFLKDDDLSKSYFEFQLACSTTDAKSPLAEFFTKTLAQQLGKGAHSIVVKMIRLSKYNEELAVGNGTFNLDLSSGKDKLRGLADSYDAKEIEARRMPEAAMKNAGIEKDLMINIKHDFDEPITALRASIINTDWEILRDEYNVITGRIIAGYVAFKVPRNGRCFYKKITIYQPYAGGGKYGLSTYYDTRVSSDLMELKPENVMK